MRFFEEHDRDILLPFTEALDVEIPELRKNVSDQYGLPNEPRDRL